jgi:hypothetical protein
MVAKSLVGHHLECVLYMATQSFAIFLFSLVKSAMSHFKIQQLLHHGSKHDETTLVHPHTSRTFQRYQECKGVWWGGGGDVLPFGRSQTKQNKQVVGHIMALSFK